MTLGDVGADRSGASAPVRSTASQLASQGRAAASERSRSSRRATRISSAPGSRASRFAVASPMPLEAPVTR
jgi:hypothetical protein